MAADAAIEEAPARRNPWPKRILKGAVIALAAIAVLLGAAYWWLDTSAGHRFITRQIEGLEFETGMEIDIGEIDGSIYGDMILRDLEVSDAEGVFLVSPAIAIDWRPFAFLNDHVDIRSLTSELVVLRRLPRFKPTTREGPLLPDLDIDVGRLSIDRFVAEAPVTGERRVLSLAGKVDIADRRAIADLDVETIGVNGAAGGDRLALMIDAVPEDNRFAIDLDLDAPADGVFAALAGVNDPIRVQLKGQGDWERWDGRLAANLAGTEFARLGIGARNGTFTLEGTARASRLFEGQAAAFLGEVTTIDLTADLEERRADIVGAIGSDAVRIDLDGLVDLGGNAFQDFAVNAVLLQPSVLAENLRGRGVLAKLLLDGAFATPSVNYAIEAAEIAINDLSLQQFSATGEARVDADKILIPVSARIARITGLDTVAGGRLADVRLNGDIAIDGARILSDNLRLRSDRIDSRLILLADMSTGLYTAAIDGRIDDYRVESVGIFDIATDVDLESAGSGGFALAGRVRARSSQLFNESARNFLGGNAVAASDVRYGPDGIVRFSNLTLSAPAARITNGSGSYNPNGQIVFNADGFTDAYGAVGIRLTGTISDPRATVTAERPGLGIGLANLTARVTAARGGYRLVADGDTDYGALSADVVLGTGPQLTLDINNANLAGIDFAGSLRQTPAGPFAGRLDAKGLGFGGVVRLSANGGVQEAIVNARARNTVLPGPAALSIGSAVVDARVILYDQPYVVADAQFQNTRYGETFINAARVEVDYRGGRGNARLLAEGTNGVPFRIGANADLTPDLWRAAIKGRVRGVDFRTASPARIVPRGGSYELLPTRIDFGSGNVRLAGTYGNGIKIQSRLDRLDMAILNAFAPGLGINGSATGSLDFAQSNPSAFPRADARLTIRDFQRTTAVSTSQPVNINFVGKLLADGGEARAVMRRRGSVIGRIVASLRPLPPGSGSWTTRMLQAPLSGGIRYNGPADTLFSFAGTADQRLSGPIGVAADFSGRVARPQLAGIIRANRLVYENQTYGTRLSDMAIAARFSGDRLEIERLTAVAGDGTLEAQGFVSLAEANGYPMDVRATLDNARLARSDALSASATGQLRLTKAAGDYAVLSGDIVLPETRYQIVRQGAAQVPALTGVRFKPPRGPVRITGDEPVDAQPGLFEQVRLDIDLSAPEQLYVSGMGLESEWTADLNLSGTSAAPVVAGQVELVRGTLGFAGRSFELAEGRVGFTGGRSIDPTIDLVASEEIDDVTVNVNVSGRATNPQISFASTPGLPQDEILSRILFGNSVGNLSAIQSVQLAASLNSLRGSGGGLNPLGKLRSATGIDRLRILGGDETTGRGTALAAGQYITDDIYIEFITDARGFTATQLEVALTPALSLLSQAGGSGATNVEVRYRKNY
ncbi:translocation/assembly module TamB domain-containing protein [Sphingomicrobium sp. XHP0235]|uniref:translocation/assembly module TamB domain-containing protein n=1 Tax=Sphingomicrobium aquimarinum TaxID=3133971 RepID=UPI0031FF201C